MQLPKCLLKKRSQVPTAPPLLQILHDYFEHFFKLFYAYYGLDPKSCNGYYHAFHGNFSAFHGNTGAFHGNHATPLMVSLFFSCTPLMVLYILIYVFMTSASTPNPAMVPYASLMTAITPLMAFFNTLCNYEHFK